MSAKQYVTESVKGRRASPEDWRASAERFTAMALQEAERTVADQRRTPRGSPRELRRIAALCRRMGGLR